MTAKHPCTPAYTWPPDAAGYIHCGRWIRATGRFAGRRLDSVPCDYLPLVTRGRTTITYSLADRRQCLKAVPGDMGGKCLDVMFSMNDLGQPERKWWKKWGV